jgi:prolipoprotein diacylglyceryltransferase
VLFEDSLDFSDFFNFRTGGLSIIGAIICGALYLLLNMPTLHSLLAMLPLIGSIISEFSAGFAHEFAVCGVVYGVIGLALILGTTVFRVFFSSLFDAIFGRD